MQRYVFPNVARRLTDLAVSFPDLAIWCLQGTDRLADVYDVLILRMLGRVVQIQLVA